MIKRKNYILQIFTGARGDVSSKRVFGALGWCVVLWSVVYCTLNNVQAPDITEYVAIVSASLLGIGVFEGYNWNKSKVNAPPTPDPYQEDRDYRDPECG